MGMWVEYFERCVEAIHDSDYSTAALALLDAFETDRTILESDVDIVRRELVRAALGRSTDIRRTLLDRYNTRRTIEHRLESATADRLYPWRRGPSVSVANLAEFIPMKAPNGLDSVEAALEGATFREGPRPDLHLLQAALAACRGKREEMLAAFEHALDAGADDTKGKLARFVELEKHALELGVQLDIQELLVAVGKAALSNSGDARRLAELVKSYTEYLGIPLDPLSQRMIDTQLRNSS
jgi:hypothetical protein